MSHRLTLAAAIAACAAALPLGAQHAPLTISRITMGVPIAGTAPASPSWSPDSRTVAFLWSDAAGPRDLWRVDRTGGAARRLTRFADSSRAVSEVAWAPDGRALVAIAADEVVRVDATTGAVTVLTRDGRSKGELTLSSDGTRAAWLADGDLWMVPLTGGAVEQLTHVGVAPIGALPYGTYHRPDVEVGPGMWGGAQPSYAWAPDGRHIALHVVDRRMVKTLDMPYYLDGPPTMQRVRRGAPGDENEARTVRVLDLGARTLDSVPLADPQRFHFVAFGYNTRGALLLDRESDDATVRQIHVLDAGASAPRRAWEDTRATRIYNDVTSAWGADGALLVTSDLDDRYRVWRLDPAATRMEALTPATSDVQGAAMPTSNGSEFFFTSTAPDPAERHAWRMSASGGPATRLTSRSGTNLATPSPDGGALAVLFSDDVTPTELGLMEATPAATMRVVTRTPTREFATHAWVKPQYVSVTHVRDPFTLRARVFLPPGLDRTKRHPVLFGPVYSNTVRNAWNARWSPLMQYLAIEKGYVVVQVDVRGSTGYGRAFREAFLGEWGRSDLGDLESVVAWLKTQPWADTERMGIWGSSYGGLLSVYALLGRPGLFRAGVAGAPAVDPRWFGSDDAAIARTPAEAPATFERRAARDVGNLRDHLLMIHGMQDDVVPFHTSVQLLDAFIGAGKDVEVAFAPAATHGWAARPAVARYLFTRLVDFLDRWVAGR